MQYYVYIVRCGDDTLYTGITTDMERRLRQHNGELLGGAVYTRSRRPVTIQYVEMVSDRASAQSREAIIKALSKEDKMRLIIDTRA